MDCEASPVDKPGELWFIRKSSVFEKISTAVRRVNEKPEPAELWFTLSSGAWIRTKDLRVMSPTSYRCSTPHQLTLEILSHSSNGVNDIYWIPAQISMEIIHIIRQG